MSRWVFWEQKGGRSFHAGCFSGASTVERRWGNRRRTKWDRVQGWDLTGGLEQGWPGGVAAAAQMAAQ